MSQNNIRTALDTRLLSVPGGIAAAWTEWDNHGLKAAPAITQPYQKASLLPANPDTPGLSEQTTIHAGIYQVLLMMPINAGPLAGETSAQLVVNHFYAGLSLTYGGQTIRIRGTPEIAGGYVSGERYAVPVSVRYNSIVS